jgi:hypothetical protein
MMTFRRVEHLISNSSSLPHAYNSDPPLHSRHGKGHVRQFPRFAIVSDAAFVPVLT